ncbi:BRCT domain-containing protein [Phytomonospora sp. NPDC050363]|uniref:BRCT domain-containing protein n=1 Tax=Phytomonospora sp. NPDC050363 TaxID=3155642 RepID=UPI003400A979
MRVYIEGWDSSANQARRLAKETGIEIASKMDGDITHLVVGYAVRMKAAHHEFAVNTGVPLLSPDEFRYLVTGEDAEARPLGEVKTGPPPPIEGQPRMWRGSPPNTPKEVPIDYGLWIIPLMTCGFATPFCFAYLATKRLSVWQTVWAVVYGFVLGYAVTAMVEEGAQVPAGVIALAVSGVVGSVHLVFAGRAGKR